LKLKAVNGTQDILPSESHKWQFIESQIRQFMSNYNYSEIRTPIFEHTELFSRGIGELTDIVSKEMYTFVDSGDRMLTLRPENTASVVRMAIEHNMLREMPQTKLFYIGPMFRRERPQKGRYRQFHQFGIEAIGPKSPELDVEVMLLAIRFYQSLNLKNLTLHVNSVGDAASRDAYREALKAFVKPQLASYCDDCNQRFEKNPLRILDCKKDVERNAAAPKIIDYLSDESKSYFHRVIELLDLHNITYNLDHALVRGLDYYSDVVFEISSSDIGAQAALCGGGRYDGLFSELGGKETASIGFAGGLERLLLALDANTFDFPNNRVQLFVGTMDEDSRAYASVLVDELRASNIAIETEYLARSVKAQMKFADKLGAKFSIVIGQDEIKSETFQVKDMSTGTIEEVQRADLITHIRTR
jgi:histidyl-tRNA synthetase